MRRFASVFVSKRDKDRHRQHPPLDIPALHAPDNHNHNPATPPLIYPAYHSSASSSGSASLSIRTPDEDHPDPHRTLAVPSKRSWKSWFSGKRATSLAASHPPSSQPDPPSSPTSLPPAALKRTPQPILPVLTNRAEDSDEDSPSEDSDDEDSSHFLPSSSTSSPFIPSPPSVPLAKRNLAANTAFALQPPEDPSPFVQYPNGPLFPKSSNSPALLMHSSNTMLSSMFRKRLLKRLEDPSLTLTQAEERSLLPFSSRPAPAAPAVTDSPTLSYNDPRPNSSTKVFSSSPGLRSWIARPCFEDRYHIILPADNGSVVLCPVSSAFAVAALEYSDSIDAMVDPDFDASSSPPSNNISTVPLSEIELPSPVALTPVPPNEPSSTQPTPRPSSYKALSSSPLRNQHTPAGTAPKHMLPAVKRVVRFADNDDDEETPLYILRAKKMREEKAKFLRREQLKRKAEVEKEMRAREEEEQRQREEFMERERRRLAKEQEKKERDRRLYAEEVTAARLRRESFRAGIISNSSNTLIPSSSSTPSLGDSDSNRLRDSTKRQSQLSRKEVSDSTSHLHPHGGSSSGGSRPPSGAYSPASVSHSRPPSTYSHSSDEVRQIKRSSLAPSAPGSYRPVPERSWTLPNWGGSTQSLHAVPPVPPVPDYMSMPLLPPAAPFMMMQYPKRQSSRQSSPAPRSSSGSRRGSVNSSSERVNAHERHRQHSHSPHSHSPNSSSPHRPSNDRRSSMPAAPSQGSQSVKSQPRSPTGKPQPRGRMAQQQQQQPNPWTALPSQTGRPPVMMPVSSYTHGNTGKPRSTSGRQSMYS